MLTVPAAGVVAVDDALFVVGAETLPAESTASIVYLYVVFGVSPLSE